MSTPKYTSATSQAKCETRYESQSLPGDTSRYQSFFGNGAELPDPTLAWEDLSPEDRRALTELLVDKIVVAPPPHKIVDGRRATAPSAPSRTKIPSKRLSGSRQCTRLESRSSPEPEQLWRYQSC
jgi:hypothetical protein